VLAITQPGRLTSQEVKNPPLVLLQQADALPTSSDLRITLGVRALEISPIASIPFLEAALAVDPNGWRAKDALAAVLAITGDDVQALDLLEASIASAPRNSGHFYLSPDASQWLSEEEQSAVERGFSRAIQTEGYWAAVALARYRRSVNQFEESAEAWQYAAKHAGTRREEGRCLRAAGSDYIRADKLDAARSVLKEAVLADPTAHSTYTMLLTGAEGRLGDINDARTTHAAGIANGADLKELDLALAQAFRLAGRLELEREALTRWVAAHPHDSRGHYSLGISYYSVRDWSRAAESFRSALSLDSTMAACWYNLGRAEERRYRFVQALEAYERAVLEGPRNATYSRNFDRFVAKIVRSAGER